MSLNRTCLKVTDETTLSPINTQVAYGLRINPSQQLTSNSIKLLDTQRNLLRHFREQNDATNAFRIKATA